MKHCINPFVHYITIYFYIVLLNFLAALRTLVPLLGPVLSATGDSGLSRSGPIYGYLLSIGCSTTINRDPPTLLRSIPKWPILEAEERVSDTHGKVGINSIYHIAIFRPMREFLKDLGHRMTRLSNLYRYSRYEVCPMRCIEVTSQALIASQYHNWTVAMSNADFRGAGDFDEQREGELKKVVIVNIIGNLGGGRTGESEHIKEKELVAYRHHIELYCAQYLVATNIIHVARVATHCMDSSGGEIGEIQGPSACNQIADQDYIVFHVCIVGSQPVVDCIWQRKRSSGGPCDVGTGNRGQSEDLC